MKKNWIDRETCPDAQVSEATIMMDGTEHSGDECQQDRPTHGPGSASAGTLSCRSRVCADCKVILHWQPVYGGYYFACPGCGATSI